MPYVGQSPVRSFRVRRISTGALEPGLVTGSFTFTGYRNGSGASLSPSVAALGGGYYTLTVTNPGSPGHVDLWIVPSDSDLQVEWPDLAGHVPTYDEDRLASIVIQPKATLTQSFQIGLPIPLDLVAYRFRELAIPIVNNGVAVDLSGYTNWALAVRHRDLATAVFQVGHGQAGWNITGDASGNLAITVPEDLITNGSVVAWAGTTAYAHHNVVRPTVANGYLYTVKVAGTSSGSQPTWPITPGATVVDGTVTWICCNDFFSLLAAGASEYNELLYEVTADKAGDAAKTQPIIRSSPLRLLRREVQP